MDEHQKRLVDYVNRQVARGVDKDIIVKGLRDIGWSQDRIDASFVALKNAELNNMLGSAPQRGKLPGPLNLFGRAWSLFRSRLGLFIGLTFISILSNIIGQVPEFMRMNSLIVVILLVLVSVFLSFLTGVAMVYAVASEERLTLGQVYSKGLKAFWPFAWISFLLSLMIAGGFGLLIVPGILFAVWFSLAIWIFASEGTRGMDAMLKSKEYVRGFFWPILGRLVFVGLLPLFIMLPLMGFVFFEASFALIAVPLMIAMFFILPTLTMSYGFLMYRDLKMFKGSVAIVSTGKRKAKFILMGIGGFIILIAVPIVFIFISLNPTDALAKARDAQRISDLASLKTAIALYQSQSAGSICEIHDIYGSKPGTTAIDGSGWLPIDFTLTQGGAPISNLPTDPGSSMYLYICDPEDQTYELNAFLESDDLYNRSERDGGNNPRVYEVGTDLMLWP